MKKLISCLLESYFSMVGLLLCACAIERSAAAARLRLSAVPCWFVRMSSSLLWSPLTALAYWFRLHSVALASIDEVMMDFFDHRGK